MDLAREIRGLRLRSSTDALQSAQEKRELLQKQIDSFRRQSVNYLPVEDANRELDLPESDEWLDVEDDDADFDPPDTQTVDEIAVLPPERQSIPLPSSFGKEKCRTSLKHLAEIELDLRIGQANDTLRFLRIAIGQKSFLYRTKIRQASGYSKRLRNYSDAHALQMSIVQAAKLYAVIRSTMESLGASHQVLAKYAVLTKEDVVASTAVVDPNASGVRNKTLSWIWRMRSDGVGDPEWLDERKAPHLHRRYRGSDGTVQCIG